MADTNFDSVIARVRPPTRPYDLAASNSVRVEIIEDSLPSLRAQVGGRGITQFALDVEGVQDVAGICRKDALFADPPISPRYVRAVEHHPIPGTSLAA